MKRYKKKNQEVFIVFFLTVLFLLPFSASFSSKQDFKLGQDIFVTVEKQYGSGARERLLNWEKLIREDNSATDIEKLDKVNKFFNQLLFIDDISHWGKEDYWATPVEFLASQGGDCEDFSLAKYFTLLALGVAEKKLNLTYVKALKLNQAHMVMTYFSKPGADPLVLDNLVGAIIPASQRKDLLPVYSFNGSGLWLAKQRGRGKLVGSSERLKRWQDVLKRMPNIIPSQ